MILFLDFDGVLHPEDDSFLRFNKNHILHEMLRRLPGSMVVFSTTWRTGRSHAELVRLASHGAPELSSRFIGSTPDLPIPDSGLDGHRQLECLAWMAKHSWQSPWIAIDDHPEWFSDQSRVLAVDPSTGLVTDDVERLLSMAETAEPRRT